MILKHVLADDSEGEPRVIRWRLAIRSNFVVLSVVDPDGDEVEVLSISQDGLFRETLCPEADQPTFGLLLDARHMLVVAR